MKWEIEGIETWPWSRHPLGLAGLAPGNSVLVRTGNWRSQRPVWEKERCNSCLLCFIFCPDAAVVVKEGKMAGIDYEHCKGCGICATECGRKALRLVDEHLVQE